MKIKKGDKVKVITGHYKGTVGDVIAVFPKKEQVIVEGVNMKKKTIKPSQANPDGGIAEMAAPIHVSNVMAYDSKAKAVSRVGYTMEKNEKIRVYKKTGKEIKGGKN
ncbi:MAG: 50S ribosomal protein L24 [Anaerorhabdus sp.]